MIGTDVIGNRVRDFDADRDRSGGGVSSAVAGARAWGMGADIVAWGVRIDDCARTKVWHAYATREVCRARATSEVTPRREAKRFCQKFLAPKEPKNSRSE